MCKHQLREQFLAKKAEADKVNSLPDSSDLERVTGLTVEDFIDPVTEQVDTQAMQSQYEYAMDLMYTKGNVFAFNCKLFSNLNFKEHIVS